MASSATECRSVLVNGSWLGMCVGTWGDTGQILMYPTFVWHVYSC